MVISEIVPSGPLRSRLTPGTCASGVGDGQIAAAHHLGFRHHVRALHRIAERFVATIGGLHAADLPAAAKGWG